MTSRVTAYYADGRIRDLACSSDEAALARFATSYESQGFRVVVDGPEVIAAELARWEANPPRFREVLPGIEDIEVAQADTPDDI